MHMLNGDALLEIFHHYRLDDEQGWNNQLRWCKLSHVCRRWRKIIHQSSFHLNIHIPFMHDTPPLDKLPHLPTLPLVIDYQSGDGAEDTSGVLHAIRQSDRIHRIVIQAPSMTLYKLIMLMDKSFPRLEVLSLSSTTPEENTWPTLPRTFLAPNLRHLAFHSICPPLLFLSFTPSLVTLELIQIQAPSYFTPEDLVTQLGLTPQLEELSIAFSTPLPRPNAEGELFYEPITPTTLPVLKRLVFRGISAYLESVLSRIQAPLLKRFNITLFNDLAFTLPHTTQFISTTEGLRHPVSSVIFTADGISFILGSRNESSDGPGTFSLDVSCQQIDWQIDAATQICGALAPILSIAEQLTIHYHEHEESLPCAWQDAFDGLSWRGLLEPFKKVKTLHMGYPLASELSSTLESDDAGLISKLLPELLVLEVQLEIRHASSKAYTISTEVHRLAGRPVRLLITMPPTTPSTH